MRSTSRASRRWCSTKPTGLLDLGFAAELEQVLAALPARRQTLLFSATFAEGVQALAAGLLRDAVRIEAAAPASEAPAIVQRVIEVDAGRRTELLRHLVRQGGWRRAPVFVATRYATEHLARKLSERAFRRRRCTAR
jgi:superfamily II DNA/RNA helicase